MIISDCSFITNSESRSGEPVKVQRTIFSEVFYVMAMSSLYTLTSQEKYKVIIRYQGGKHKH